MLDRFSDYGYLGVFCAIIATGFGLPMPEELPVLTGGVLVGHADTPNPGQTTLPPDRLRWWIMLPVSILAVVVGDGFLYGVGRLWGPRLLDNAWVKRKVLSPEKRGQIEKNFHDRGVMILLTARLTPGIRTPIFVMAGVLRVPLARFLLADGLYAVPGVSVMFWLGYFLTDQVLEAFNKAQHYRALIVFGVLCAVTGAVAYRLLVNRRVTTGNRKDVPMIVKPVEMVTEAATHAVEKTAAAAAHAVEKVAAHLSHGDKPAPKPPEPSVNGVAKIDDPKPAP